MSIRPRVGHWPVTGAEVVRGPTGPGTEHTAMGKHRKPKGPAPTQTTQAARDWNAQDPQAKADSFDAQYAASHQNAQAHADQWRRPQPDNRRKVSE